MALSGPLFIVPRTSPMGQDLCNFNHTGIVSPCNEAFEVHPHNSMSLISFSPFTPIPGTYTPNWHLFCKI